MLVPAGMAGAVEGGDWFILLAPLLMIVRLINSFKFGRLRAVSFWTRRVLTVVLGPLALGTDVHTKP